MSPSAAELYQRLTRVLQAARPEDPEVAGLLALHDEAATHAETDWRQIAAIYGILEGMTGNPMVTLSRAVAGAMVPGPEAGPALLDGLEERRGDHHRLHAVRAHLLEPAGDTTAAIAELGAAARRTTNLREQEYLTTKAARLRS